MGQGVIYDPKMSQQVGLRALPQSNENISTGYSAHGPRQTWIWPGQDETRTVAILPHGESMQTETFSPQGPL